MTGFLPVGYQPLKDAAATVGIDRLGSALAGGVRRAFVLDPWGELRPLDAEFWRGGDAAEAMEKGTLPKKPRNGSRPYQYGGCQILVKSLQPHSGTKTANAMLAKVADDQRKKTAEPPPADAPKKRGGGRPFKYDWPAAGGYIAGYVVENDYPSQAEAAAILMKWFSDHGKTPDERDVERFIETMYSHRKTRKT